MITILRKRQERITLFYTVHFVHYTVTVDYAFLHDKNNTKGVDKLAAGGGC